MAFPPGFLDELRSRRVLHGGKQFRGPLANPRRAMLREALALALEIVR